MGDAPESPSPSAQKLLASSDETGEWVTLCSYTDPIQAQITLDFLRDSGIEVRLSGNAAMTNVFNAYGGADMRLVVQRAELAAANEALTALTSAKVIEDYRHPAQRFDEDEEEAAPKPLVRRPFPTTVLLLVVAAVIVLVWAFTSLQP